MTALRMQNIFSADAFKTGYNAFWRKIDCSWSVMDIDFTPCLIVRCCVIQYLQAV